MSEQRSHDEMAELLGAYALDAVDADEAAAVEAHLAECPRCRAEVGEHREVAALLGNSGGAAPEGVWDRIAAALDEPPPPLRLPLPDRPEGAATVPLARRGRSPRLVLGGLAAAAAVVIVALLGVQVVRQADEIDQLEAAIVDDALLSAANAALLAPDATQTRLTAPDGTFAATAVLLPDGTGYLMARELPDLADDRTYQLWGQTGGGLVSLGVLGPDPDVIPFRVSGEVAALAVTEEVAGGVVQSENPPVVLGRFA